jgi:hypothetical protein
MTSLELFGTCCIVGEGSIPPAHDNDNWRLMPDWRTPAEFMQWIRRDKERLRRKLAADFTLRSNPQYRLDWDILIAMEKCALWHCYGVR